MNDRDAWIHFACAALVNNKIGDPIGCADKMLTELKKREDKLDNSPQVVSLDEDQVPTICVEFGSCVTEQQDDEGNKEALRIVGYVDTSS